MGQERVRIGVFGGSGTTGTELVGLIRRHPRAELVFATSRGHAGGSLRDVDPAAPDVPLVDPREVSPDGVDLVFLCLPHGRAAEHASRWFQAGCRVVDLSGDLRLRDPEVHARVYGSPREQALVEHVVYGLTEHARPQLDHARLVSNPGCYPTCVTLPLLPLTSRIDGPVVVNAMSGVSGAGRKAVALTHFCAVADDVRPYKLGRAHRHVAEMEQILADGAPEGPSPRVLFNPHVVPLERGMLATITARTPGMGATEARTRLEQAYQGEPFVEVLPEGQAARIRHVVRTNRAVIGVHDGGADHVVLTCAIDNLLKGAAGQAVQNMNRMLGWPETLGFPEARTENG